jgi:hypothetical protein
LLDQLENWYDMYTDPDLDGRNSLVTGRGQIDMIKGGEKPFADDVIYFSER